MSSPALSWREESFGVWKLAGVFLRPLSLALAFPSVLYLIAMAVFLFRPPDLFSFYADRVAFGALVLVVALRTMALRDKIPFVAGISLPMAGLAFLAVARVLREPFDTRAWSLVAGKFIVPFALFHLAIVVFRSGRERRHFEIFVLAVLAYLIFIAVAFLAGARDLIYPRFILDESLGFHADRARGPFLQAVANGVSLNILGLLAAVFAPRHKIASRVLWTALPIAVLATMTRAVWISFLLSALVTGARMTKHHWRFLLAVALLASLLFGIAAGISSSFKTTLGDRAEERGPVNARLAVYSAGWTMFLDHPLSGWPFSTMYSELARRMEGYHLRTFYVHNTYLALLIEFGLPGLALYVTLFFNLFRLSRAVHQESPCVAALRRAWPVILSVYLFNAFFVDMAYQFVIGLLFTVAGILCASEEHPA